MARQTRRPGRNLRIGGALAGLAVGLGGAALWWGSPRPPTPATEEGVEQTRERYLASRRSQAPALSAGRLLAPWSRIRTALGRAEPAPTALLDQIDALVQTLLSTRRDPAGSPAFEETVSQSRALAERIRREGLASDPEIAGALTDHERALRAWRRARRD